jgi:hypothetical protein
VELKRSLNLFDATLIIIGNVVGAGIFTTSGFLAGELPHPLFFIGIWIIGGLLTLCGALTYAETAGMFPHSGLFYPRKSDHCCWVHCRRISIRQRQLAKLYSSFHSFVASFEAFRPCDDSGNLYLPLVFIGFYIVIAIQIAYARPLTSIAGLCIALSGLPFYFRQYKKLRRGRE